MGEDPLDEEVVLSSEKEGQDVQGGARVKGQLKRPRPKTNELVISDDD